MKRLLALSVLLLAFTLIRGKNKVEISSLPKMTFTLQGKVVDEETKLPITTALTIYVETWKPIRILTNHNGEFITTLPIAAECIIKTRAKGFDPQEDVVPILLDKEGEGAFVEIMLTPSTKLTLEGHIRSEKDKSPVNAELKVYRNSDFIMEGSTICHGQFSEVLSNYGWYLIDLSAPGYMSVMDTLWVLNCHRKVLSKDYFLKPIEAGLTLSLKEIHFSFGTATITSDSYLELGKIAEFLAINPMLRVEIGGHTDSEGPDDYNLLLSQQRAEAVTTALTQMRVNPSQLSARGYGETKPIASNNSALGKAANRRVELVVLK